MHLDTVTRRFKEPKEDYAWGVLFDIDGELYDLQRGDNIPTNKWISAYPPDDKNRIDGIEYGCGFHAFTELEDALRYQIVESLLCAEPLVIRRLRLRGVHTMGMKLLPVRRMAPVMVAREMKVLKSS